jgi:protein-arginine kinase activator protein McsA
MVVCGICKQTKDTKNRWVIHEHAVDNSLLRDFKICDQCATEVVRKILKEQQPESDLSQLVLTKTGLVDSVTLAEDNCLEITLSMDLAKARKLIMEKTEGA